MVTIRGYLGRNINRNKIIDSTLQFVLKLRKPKQNLNFDFKFTT